MPETSNFPAAFRTLIFWEGSKFEDDPRDAGGATKYGITLPYLRAFYKAHGIEEAACVEDIRDLTLERARIIYLAMDWKRYRYNEIIDLSAATLVLLASVNPGPFWAARSSQRALRASGIHVKIDGIIGSKTLGAINGANADVFCAAMRVEVSAKFRAIAAKDPKKHSWSLKGWINRANWPH